MRVALAIEHLDPTMGGRERSTAQLAETLNREGMDVTVLCQSAAWECEGVDVRVLGRRGVGDMAHLLGFVDAVTELHRIEAWDVLHTMFPLPGADVYQPRGGTIPAQAASARRRRNPVSAALGDIGRAMNIRRQILARLERKVARNPRCFCVGGSEMVCKEFETHYGRTDRVVLVFNAADVPDLSESDVHRQRVEVREGLGIGKQEVVFLTVAKNFELKGVPQAIEAFSRWWRSHRQAPKGRLLVVGRKPQRRHRKLARRWGVDKWVHFIEPTIEIFRWYSAADAVVLLSWYDACSRVVLEAVRWGRPCITTIYNGAAEILAGGAGIVVASPDEMSDVVAAMGEMSDEEHRARCAKACGEVADFLGFQRHVRELLGVYRRVVDAK